MRLLDYLLGGLALLALPFLVWWGIYQSPQSAVNLQSRLEAQAQAALAASGANWATVRMDGQRAVITGAAPSADAVIEAARTVRRSSGAGGVIFGGVTLVEARVEAAQPVSPYIWRARKTEDGQIVLSGSVPSKSIQAHLVEEARLVGRAAVADEMQLAAGAPAGNFQGVARIALAALVQLEQGEVTITDHRVVLRGSVAEPATRSQVAASLASIAAPFKGEPMIAGDVRWRAEISPGVLTLSGAIPDQAQRRALLAATSGFAGEVVDEMTLGAAPAEGWLAGALAGLPEFTKFRSGDMAFDATAGAFLFDGVADASTLYFLKEDMTRAGRPWKAVIGAEMPQKDTVHTQNVTPALVNDTGMTCEDALQNVLARGDIRFADAGSTLARESRTSLDEIAGIARNCSTDKRFEIEAPGSVQASELTDFLAAAGVPRARLAAISSGSLPSEADNQSEDTGADLQQPVRIRVLERSRE
ncbi:hypothetical protein K1X12_07295 [Hyphomonas sp. WL0036]|uniref:hypothetical protein n=1 Tax=Hyphomonas sediminis TaxID=2866160 RepID=UPI001C7F2A90|nr:hypothetical protein [Hyphomonas sediminis]MBY9066699.1 hypothetical protein [Hyphomonas sediminis]